MAFGKLGVAPGCFRGKVRFLTVFGDVLSSFSLRIFASPQNLLSKLCLFSVDQEPDSCGQLNLSQFPFSKHLRRFQLKERSSSYLRLYLHQQLPVAQ